MLNLNEAIAKFAETDKEYKVLAADRRELGAVLADYAKETDVEQVVPFKGGQGVMYRYAPLDKIVKVVAPLLTRHGLSYNIKTMIELMDSAPFMVATLNIYHSLGHTETSEFRVPLNAAAIDATHMNDAQRYGSAGTYAKRNAFVGFAAKVLHDEKVGGLMQKSQELKSGSKKKRC